MKINCKQEQNHFLKREKVFGQFFTPKEVTEFILDFVLVNRNIKNRAIDPACGDGIFVKGLIERGFKEVVGIDIDKGVINSIPKDIKSKATIINKNGLLNNARGDFDVVVGNPPFSAKYGRVKEEAILSCFEFGENRKSQAIEILFLERFIRLASKGGVIGIVLPHGIISNNNLKFVRDYLLKKTQILGVISLPRFIFNGSLSTSSKTCLLFLRKCTSENKKIFMSIIQNLDQLKEIVSFYTSRKKSSHMAFWTEIENSNLSPEFYNPDLKRIEKELKESSFKVEKLGNLISEMFCGRTEYGENRIFSRKGIKFISAKVVTNLGLDFKRDRKFISKNTCMFKKNALVRKNDLIFVRVGVGCAGKTSVVTSDHELGIVDDWSYVIRTDKQISPYFLAFYLHTKYAKAQVNRIKRGVGTITIPQSALREILVPLFDSQEKFKNLYLEMRKNYKNGNIEKAKKIFNEVVNFIETMIR